MHKYIPRLHIIQTYTAAGTDNKLPMASLDNVNVFVFPETQFIAVTAYQNEDVSDGCTGFPRIEMPLSF